MKVQRDFKGLLLRIMIALCLFFAIFVLDDNQVSAGCYVHRWSAATCTKPKTCAVCGATQGRAMGHSYKAATCTSPQTCTRCGSTAGSKLGHSYRAANCENPRTCSRCGSTVGSALGHSWQPATCTQARHCDVCGKNEGGALGHNYAPATCTSPKTCRRCGGTTGNANGHSMAAASCTEAKHCTVCGYTVGSALGHSMQAATCQHARYCDMCGKTEGSPLPHSFDRGSCTERKKCTVCGTLGDYGPHIYKAATCTEPRKCKCGATTGEALGHSWQPATCTQARQCDVCGATEGEALGHDYAPATCTKPSTCRRCGNTSGKENGHHMKRASCTEPRHCTECGYSIGEALDHSWLPATCKHGRYCDICGLEEGDPLPHNMLSATCQRGRYCSMCGYEEGGPVDHVRDEEGKCIWCGEFDVDLQLNQKIDVDEKGDEYQDHIYVLINPEAEDISHKYFGIFERTYIGSNKTITFGGYITNSHLAFKEGITEDLIDLAVNALSFVPGPVGEYLSKGASIIQLLNDINNEYDKHREVNGLINDRYNQIFLQDYLIGGSVRNIIILNAYKASSNDLGANPKENTLYDITYNSSSINLCTIFGHDYRYMGCGKEKKCICGAIGEIANHEFVFAGDGIPYICAKCGEQSDKIAEDNNNPYLHNGDVEEHEHVVREYESDLRCVEFYHADPEKAHLFVCDICEEWVPEAHDYVDVAPHIQKCAKCHYIKNSPCTLFQTPEYLLIINTKSEANRLCYAIRERKCEECGKVETYAAYIDFDLLKKESEYYSVLPAVDFIIEAVTTKVASDEEIMGEYAEWSKRGDALHSGLSCAKDVCSILSWISYINDDYDSLIQKSGIVVYRNEEFLEHDATLYNMIDDFAEEHYQLSIQ